MKTLNFVAFIFCTMILLSSCTKENPTQKLVKGNTMTSNKAF